MGVINATVFILFCQCVSLRSLSISLARHLPACTVPALCSDGRLGWLHPDMVNNFSTRCFFIYDKWSEKDWIGETSLLCGVSATLPKSLNDPILSHCLVQRGQKLIKGFWDIIWCVFSVISKQVKRMFCSDLPGISPFPSLRSFKEEMCIWSAATTIEIHLPNQHVNKEDKGSQLYKS